MSISQITFFQRLSLFSSFFLRRMATEVKRVKLEDNRANRLIWVDLEVRRRTFIVGDNMSDKKMTGLDVDTDQIIEMACLVTDSQLGIIAEGPNLVVHQSDDVLNAMGEWCTQHHAQSGLTEAVRASKTSLKDAEQQIVEFVQRYTPSGVCPLAGNSVHMDKRFLDKHMPNFSKHLHYRIIDVSSVKELCKRWHPDVYNKAPQKSLTHRALDDIKESISELEFYRKTIFK